MQQLRFTIENRAETKVSLSLPAEQERKLIELMARAILAVLRRAEGEEDERT